MRTLKRNKQAMKYSTPSDSVEVTRTYTDEDGNEEIVYTGEKISSFSEPIKFKACINNQLSESTLTSYGIDDSTNYAQIVLNKGELPLKIGDVIWLKSDVEYKTVSGVTVVDEDSADYIVKGIADEGLNFDLYLLQRNTQ